MYNLLQENKDDTCFEEQVMTIQDEYDEYNDIIDEKPSSYEEFQFKKNDV